VQIIGFADDITIVVVAKQLQKVEILGVLENWLAEVGLELAEQKTEAELISSRKKVEHAIFNLDGAVIISKRDIRYLGAHIGTLLRL